MKLFEPGRIGQMVTKSRIAMCPMATGLADPGGGFSRRLIDYYVARAKGGTGLIITGRSPVNTILEPVDPTWRQTWIDSFGHLGRLSELCDTVHRYRAKIAIQLSPGMGRVGFPSPNAPQPVSASAVPCFWDPSVRTRELTIEEIEMLVRACGTAAGFVKAAASDAYFTPPGEK